MHMLMAVLSALLYTLVLTAQARSISLEQSRIKRAPNPNHPQIDGLSNQYITAVIGEEFALLPCLVKNRGESYIHWFKDDVRIDSKSNSYQVLKGKGLKVKRVKKESEGEYVCQVTHDEVIVMKTIHLLVEEQPGYVTENIGPLEWDFTNTKTTVNLKVSEGADATFRCSVRGEPNIHARWYIDDKLLAENISLTNKNIKYRNSSVGYHTRMIWKDVKLSDNDKKVTCLVTQETTNGTQRTLTRQFTLIIRGANDIPPTIVNDNAQPLIAYVGENYTYDCRLLKAEQLDSIVFFTWGIYLGVNNATGNLQITKPKSGATLTILNVTKEDERQYICVVSDQKKQDHKIFNLTVLSDEEDMVGPEMGKSLVPSGSRKDNALPVILTVIGAVVVVVIVVSVVIVCMKKRKPVKHPKKRIILLAPNDNYMDFMKDSSSDLIEPLMPPMVQIQGGRNRLSSEICSYSDYEFPLDENWEVRPRNRVQMMHLLGEGAFGCVYYAELKPSAADDSTPVTPIAVKMLKSDATDKELVDLVQELEVMKKFGQHKNIINLVGCMTRDGPLYVIVEYARHGNLRDFLRTHRPRNSYGSRILNMAPYDDLQLTQRHLVVFAHEIASGMQYLASNQCLHRDLAARNVLVGESYEMKIADFGLSRNIAQSDYYKKVTEGKLPIKWMAPEALIDRKYTTKSDVWAYGVLLWEIFTLGGNPYPTVPHERLFEALREGHRMDRPAYSSVDLYAIMRQCWQYHPAQRPTFSEILDDLDEIINTASKEYLDIDCSPITSPRESTTSNCTSTTSFSTEEPAPPPVLPLPLTSIIV